MSNMLKLPKPPNLTELAYQSVKQQLLNGSFPEGTKLTEEFLSNQLGISKSPVREALMRLESEGLICIESRRGAYVRKFSAKDVMDLYDIRALLEVHAVGIARVTPILLTNMTESIERTRQHVETGNRPQHIAEDIHFHGLIANSTGNAEFGKLLDNIQQKTLLCRMATFSLTGTVAPASHRHIYEAMRDGNLQAAQRAMHEHILYVRDTLLRSLDADAECTPPAAEEPMLQQLA